jgi:hypothetical protein
MRLKARGPAQEGVRDQGFGFRVSGVGVSGSGLRIEDGQTLMHAHNARSCTRTMHAHARAQCTCTDGDTWTHLRKASARWPFPIGRGRLSICRPSQYTPLACTHTPAQRLRFETNQFLLSIHPVLAPVHLHNAEELRMNPKP